MSHTRPLSDPLLASESESSLEIHYINEQKDSGEQVYDESSRQLTRGELTEFMLQVGINIALNGITGYDFLITKSDLARDVVFYFSLVAYVAVSSGISLTWLYQLAPYLSHTQNLKEKILAVREQLYKTETEVLAFQNKLKACHDYLDKIVDYYPIHIPVKYFKKSNTTKKINCGTFFTDSINFIFNAATGAVAGLNFNRVMNVTFDALQSYLPAPLVLATMNSFLNQLVMSAIRKDKVFIPSYLMLSHALTATDEQVRCLDVIAEKHNAYHDDLMRLDNVLSKFEQLPQLAHIPRVVAAPLSAPSRIDISAEHAQVLPQQEMSCCMNWGMALASMLPILLAEVSAIFSTVVEDEEHKGSVAMNIILAAVVFAQLAALTWRMRRYHHNDGVQVLSLFFNDNSDKKIAALEINTEDSKERLAYLLIKSTYVANNFFVKKDHIPIQSNDEKFLYDFVADCVRRKLHHHHEFASNPIIVRFKESLQHQRITREYFEKYFDERPDELNQLRYFYKHMQDAAQKHLDRLPGGKFLRK